VEITTNKGVVRLPAYLPVTTWGNEYPLDSLIRPFMPRFADMLMVSYHYAQEMDAETELPVFIDSGGFALLLEGAELVEREDGLANIRRSVEGDVDVITPEKVLELQHQKAQWGSTLDFPIPPSLDDPVERERRLHWTLMNAQWAIQHSEGTSLRLFGSVQGWDEESYVECAQRLLAMGFKDLAMGGFVPRASRREFLLQVTRRIRSLMASDAVLHAFGMGEPEMVRSLYAAGVSSVDSSSFVRAAASGKRWDGGWSVDQPSGLERAHLAIGNFNYATLEVGAGHANGICIPSKTEELVDF
jgi:helicase